MRNSSGVSKRLAAAGFRKKKEVFLCYFIPADAGHLLKGFEGFGDLYKKSPKVFFRPSQKWEVSAEKQGLLQSPSKARPFAAKFAGEAYFLHTSHRMEGKKGGRSGAGDRRGGESPGTAHRHAFFAKKAARREFGDLGGHRKNASRDKAGGIQNNREMVFWIV